MSAAAVSNGNDWQREDKNATKHQLSNFWLMIIQVIPYHCIFANDAIYRFISVLFNNGSQDSNSCSVGPSIWYVVGSSLNHRQGKRGECHISSLIETVVCKTMFDTFDQFGNVGWAGLNATEIPNHNWSMRLFQCCLFSKANTS